MYTLNEIIKVFEPGTREYENLTDAARIMTEMSPNGWHYSVQDVCFNYGSVWMWTTVVCDDRGYQALTPHDQSGVLYGDLYDEDMEDILNAVFDDKYCPDC